MARRIGGAGGGSDPGPGKVRVRWWAIFVIRRPKPSSAKGNGGAVVTVTLTLAIAASGTAAVGVAASTGTSVSATGPAARAGSRATSRESTAAVGRLVRRGVRIDAQVTDDAADCAAHSYGEVQEFFRHHPCTKLHRALFVLRDFAGDAALLAVAWVEMPDEEGARTLERLIDTDGTGNVVELSRERGRYQSVRYTGSANVSRRDGTLVVNAQAQPVAGGWDEQALTSAVAYAVQQKDEG